ncbi:hypothetical protein HBJ00_22365 [Aeromonas veronii]|nr:hypothetical protein [Aeromonas veronii]
MHNNQLHLPKVLMTNQSKVNKKAYVRLTLSEKVMVCEMAHNQTGLEYCNSGHYQELLDAFWHRI